jgi:hypothetical protein
LLQWPPLLSNNLYYVTLILIFLHSAFYIIKAKQTKLLASQANFQKFWWGREAPFFGVVIISVSSNAVAANTGKNHACLRHKRFTDNDREQQTYGSDRSGPEKFRKRTQFFSPQCKNDQCGSKNTHVAVPEKLTIKFFWPKSVLNDHLSYVTLFHCSLGRSQVWL